MKKGICSILLVLALFFLVSSCGNSSHSNGTVNLRELKYEEITVEINSISYTGMVITRYNGLEENIVLPNEIEGKKVLFIYDYAFKYKEIKSIELNEDLLWIGESAFENTKLESIRFNKSLLGIQTMAFGECKSLKSVDFSQCLNLIEISDFAFLNCSITSLDLSQNTQLQILGCSSFANNEGLMEIQLNNEIDYVGQNVFYNTAYTNQEGILYILNGYLLQIKINHSMPREEIILPKEIRYICEDTLYVCEGFFECISFEEGSQLEIIYSPDTALAEIFDFTNCRNRVIIRRMGQTNDWTSYIFSETVVPDINIANKYVVSYNGLKFSNNYLIDASIVDGTLYIPEFCKGICDNVIHDKITGIYFSDASSFEYFGSNKYSSIKKIDCNNQSLSAVFTGPIANVRNKIIKCPSLELASIFDYYHMPSVQIELN